MRNLTLKQLQAVGAIARLGTITAAARELNVTPAAMTSRLKQIEEETGLALFDRTSGGLRVTDAGRALLWAMDSISVTLDACTAKIEAMKGLAGGRVTLGVVSTAKYFAPWAAAAFADLHPAVAMNLVVGNRDATIASLRDYEIDLAIMGRPPVDMPVQAYPFGEHPLVVVAAPDHPLVGRTGLTRDDFVGEAFLVREEGSGTRTVFEEFMAGLVIQRPRVEIDVGSNETIKQAVMAGLGIALISGHTVEAEIESGRLALLDIDGLPIRRQWFVVRRADKAVGPAAGALWTFLIEEGSAWLPRLARSAGGSR